ncbi:MULTISPECIES: hypothetical protein [Bacteria]|uniref:hypothetical protein n=1 Tax=Streptomyces TaxID=1883 RepID=UPI0035D615D3
MSGRWITDLAERLEKKTAARPADAPSPGDDDQVDGQPGDWWDGLYDADGTPRPGVVDPEVEPEPSGVFRPASGYYGSIPHPPVPELLVVPDEEARRTEIRAALSPGTRRLIANGAAVAAGWPLCSWWGDQLYAIGTETSISGALVAGTVLCLVVAHVWDRRTRHWWWGLAWLARIPLASVVTALALYAPASQL